MQTVTSQRLSPRSSDCGGQGLWALVESASRSYGSWWRPARPRGSAVASCSDTRTAQRPFEAALQVAEVGRALPRRREVAEAGREDPAGTFAGAPGERAAERWSVCTGRGQVELTVTHSQQHVRVGSEIAELVHLVAPLPLHSEVRARGMVGVQYVSREGLCPWVSVEASADERTEVVPSIARVGRGVDPEECERAFSHAAEDHIP